MVSSPKRARARQVVLAAGAIGTPQIMMLSGLGPAAHLGEHGIEVVRDLPGVGANLQDHLQIRTSFRISGARTLNDLQAGLWGKARIAAQYALSRSGPMAMAPSQLGLFTRSHPRYATPNIEFHVQPLSLDAFGEPLHPHPAITVSACNLRPNSTGAVRLASADFRDAPVIAPNYLSDQKTATWRSSSIRLARRLLATRRMAEFRPVEAQPGIDVQSDEELAEAAGRIATTIFHPVGTARMGPKDDRMAVRRSAACRARHRRADDCRCVGDAEDRVGQYACAGGDDRGARCDFSHGIRASRPDERRSELPRSASLVYDFRRNPELNRSRCQAGVGTSGWHIGCGAHIFYH